MLREIRNTKQRKGESRRRWFYSRECELVVWLDDDAGVVGFQLAYDKDSGAHALTWKEPDGFSHAAVDSGETHPLKAKASPILLANGTFEADRIERQFRACSGELPADYVSLVASKIREYGQHRRA